MNEESIKEITKLLLEAPDSQLDTKMNLLIQKWSDPPSAIQILEVLDHCVHGWLASGIVISLLQQMYYDFACKRENTTHEEVVKKAVWRNV